LIHFSADNEVDIPSDDNRSLPRDSAQLVSLTSVIPTIDEHQELVSMLAVLKPMQLITKKLQAEDATLSLARDLFDILIEDNEGMQDYIGQDSTIISCNFFEK
jgi:hypothetical protein